VNLVWVLYLRQSTMMDPSAQPSTDDRQFPSLFSQGDDDTEVTPPKEEKRRTREFVVEEKTLKFRFPPPKDNDGNVNPLALHFHWMHEVQTAFGEDVIFFDNSNHMIGKLDPLRIKTESQTHHFNVHNVSTFGKVPESPNNTTRFFIHRIQSKHSLKEIKMHLRWLISCRCMIFTSMNTSGAKRIGT
jgi:hypothetical protein